MWFVAGNNHSKVIGRDQISASWSQHDIGFDLSENGSPETMCDDGESGYLVISGITAVNILLQIQLQLLLLQTRSSAIAQGPRDASCQWKSCQLPLNSAETTYTTSPDQIDGMKLEI